FQDDVVDHQFKSRIRNHESRIVSIGPGGTMLLQGPDSTWPAPLADPRTHSRRKSGSQVAAREATPARAPFDVAGSIAEPGPEGSGQPDCSSASGGASERP